MKELQSNVLNATINTTLADVGVSADEMEAIRVTKRIPNSNKIKIAGFPAIYISNDDDEDKALKSSVIFRELYDSILVVVNIFSPDGTFKDNPEQTRREIRLGWGLGEMLFFPKLGTPEEYKDFMNLLAQEILFAHLQGTTIKIKALGAFDKPIASELERNQLTMVENQLSKEKWYQTIPSDTLEDIKYIAEAKNNNNDNDDEIDLTELISY